MARVVVIGAGVIGLSSALALEEAGHDVSVVAVAKGAKTTSSAAGAIWYPFKVGPPDKAAAWAGQTLRWFVRLAKEHPEAGVDLLTRTELTESDEPPWWADAAPGLKAVTSLDGRPLPAGARLAWQFEAPRCDPPIFLNWLEARLRKPVTISRVTSLAGMLEGGAADVVVNCAGLGARGLTGDGALRAVYGQTVITAPGGVDLLECLGDERDEAAMFYSIPRRQEVVLGGCAEPCADDRPADPTPAMTRAILARAARMGLKPGAVVRESAGLRPCRDSVRLERESGERRIIHNYGHGGAGYTLCWGCAREVAGLVSEFERDD
jgi:D-amino-acid oxidase